ncbi:MAG: protein phosphatase 2C family protein, partial [Candidatus Cloacimonetes bacterium]|nr:protein phosphatase 2C family protein [Candidatus Cloacimonadota bacterium]
MFFGNVGDCKIALLRKGKLEYITKYNNAYKDLSVVDNNEVLAKISKNPVFTEAIGVTCERPEIIADIEIDKNDCFLIATKGVFQRVTRLEIQNAFTMWDLSEGLETVWESAQNKKSYDDFTMIALRLHKPSKSSNKGKKAGKKTNLDSPKNRTKSREPSRRTGIAFLIIFIISLIVLGITAYPYFGTLYHMIVDLI